ncbi:MAG TPA: right-handed parallel beta-helix repeat-containing protein [Xanthobacteraceae bacterium]|nr:right-handed parallel beta-helix repeat-containing protein [Xanthobacteraceae bacterium]
MAYHNHHHHHDDIDSDGTSLALNDLSLGLNPSDAWTTLTRHAHGTHSSHLTQPQPDLLPTSDSLPHDDTQTVSDPLPTQTADPAAHDATQVQPDPTQTADASAHDATQTQIPTQTIDPPANDVTPTAPDQTSTVDPTVHDVTTTAPAQTQTVDTTVHDATPTAPDQTSAVDPTVHDVTPTAPTQTQTVDTTVHDVTPTAPTQTTTVDTTAQDPTQSLPPQTGTQTTAPTAQDPTQTAGQPVNLVHTTTAIHTDHDGQVIQGLDIYVDHGDAVTITNNDVVLRDCRIHYADGNGVSISDASHVTIENCEIIDTAPPSGINQGTNENDDIVAQNAPNLTVQDTTVRDGSTGLYLLDSPGATISHVDGYDFHGPFPRGQFVQFDKSGNSTLTDFYAFNDPAHSSPEDIVSVYASPNTTISNGVIDGNNSQDGVGVMFENGSTGGRVTNVDAIHQANGAFSSYDSNVVFDHTRSFDNIATDQGRGLPSSNALIWNVSSPGVSIESSTYTHPADPGNIVWDASKAVVADVHQDPSATPMAHVTNQFDWMV